MRTIAILLPILLALVGFLVAAAVRPRPTSGIEPGSRLSNVRRRTSLWRWGGVALGLLLAVGVVQIDGALGRGVMLAAPMLALGVLVGVIAGELRIAAPATEARSAPLEVRRVRDYLPRRLTGAVAGATATLGVLLVAATAVGSPDDLGRAGRSLVRACSDVMTSSSSPWPGSFYSLPLAAIVVAGLTAAAFALQQVVRRPRQGEDVRSDDILRHSAAAAVVAASGILVTVPLAGTSAIAGLALFGSPCPMWWTTTLGWTLVGFAAGATVVAIWCATVLVLPDRSNTRHEVG
ncbi:MAG: hypothetical protein JJT89_04155 [Nitriliruptoraceae bacterium]|nr:hypothetical protein [Nitriliruptoraceae bacterium]